MHRTSYPALRRLCVLALLLGLFGMHGLAAAQANGCHGGMSTTVSITTVSNTTMTAPQAVGGNALSTVQRGMTGAMGASCLFVQAPSWPGLLLLLVTIASITASLGVGRPRTVRDFSGRSPPPAGVCLLRRICVSLT